MRKENIKNLNLTEQQSQEANSNVYPGYLVSCAGTGKTEIIVRKIEKLIDRGVPLDKIVLITFTNNATNEMRNRLSDALYKKYRINPSAFLREQIDQLGASNIFTIHKFCERLLREHGLEIDIAPSFLVGSFARESEEIIFETIKQRYEDNGANLLPTYKMIVLVKKLIESNLDKGIEATIDDFVVDDPNERLADIKVAIRDVYLQAIEEIEKVKLRKNILTKNDSIRYAAKLMQDERTAKIVAKQFKYVFVDEFQDTDNDQHKFLSSLLNAGIKLFIAGDKNQAIYNFRNANPDSFDNMASKMNLGEGGVILTENFRAGTVLIREINNIFRSKFYHNKRELKFDHIELKATRDDSMYEPMKFLESTKVTSAVEIARGNKQGYKGISVLCRTNYELERCVRALKQAKIPVVVYGGKSFYKSPCIIDTLKMLNAIIYGGDVFESEFQYTEFCLSYSRFADNANFTNLLIELRKEIKSQSIAHFLELLYKKTHLLEYLQAQNKQQEEANLHKLIDIARNFGESPIRSIEFAEYLNMMIVIEKEEDQAEIPVNKISNAVIVSTIHKAKGLSFDSVIVPNIDRNLIWKKKQEIVLDKEKVFGLDSKYVFWKKEESVVDESYERFLREKTYKDLEEELRVFFVALTRGKNQVILTSEKSIENMKYKSRTIVYASYLRWLYEIDNGDFLNKIKN